MGGGGYWSSWVLGTLTRKSSTIYLLLFHECACYMGKNNGIMVTAATKQNKQKWIKMLDLL